MYRLVGFTQDFQQETLVTNIAIIRVFRVIFCLAWFSATIAMTLDLAPVQLFLCACATLWWSRHGVKPISHQFVLYCATTMYQHLTLRVLFESCMFRDYKYQSRTRCLQCHQGIKHICLMDLWFMGLKL